MKFNGRNKFEFEKGGKISRKFVKYHKNLEIKTKGSLSLLRNAERGGGSKRFVTFHRKNFGF